MFSAHIESKQQHGGSEGDYTGAHGVRDEDEHPRDERQFRAGFYDERGEPRDDEAEQEDDDAEPD